LHDQKKPALLDKQTIETMMVPQLEDQTVGSGSFFGLGWMCDGQGDAFSFGHGGWNEGFVSSIRVCKNTGQGMVVMVNSNEGQLITDEVFKAIAREYAWPDSQIKERKAVTLEHPETFQGRYKTESGIEFEISNQNGELSLRFGKQTPLPITPKSELEFFVAALNTTIQFGKSDHDSIDSLTLHQDGNQISAKKQAESL
jgi:hypothetical protein